MLVSLNIYKIHFSKKTINKCNGLKFRCWQSITMSRFLILFVIISIITNLTSSSSRRSRYQRRGIVSSNRRGTGYGITEKPKEFGSGVQLFSGKGKGPNMNSRMGKETQGSDEFNPHQLFSGPNSKKINYAQDPAGEDDEEEDEEDDFIDYDYKHVQFEEDMAPKQFRQHHGQPLERNLPAPSGMYEFVEGKIQNTYSSQ